MLVAVPSEDRVTLFISPHISINSLGYFLFMISCLKAFLLSLRPLPPKSDVASADTASKRREEEIRYKSKTEEGRRDLRQGWDQTKG